MSDPITEYCKGRQISVIGPLGHGREGTVHETTRPSAIKHHLEQGGYLRERNAYLRLRDHAITQVRGLRVPTLVDYDDQYRILDMTIVRPPYLLDFGSAWLDQPPDFTDEAIAQWHEDICDRFGDWFPDVMAILHVLSRTAGIYLQDVSPSNIKFENPQSTSK